MTSSRSLKWMAGVVLAAAVLLAVSSISVFGWNWLRGPIERMTLRDSVLKLDPLNFGVAGGQLTAVISLDRQKNPIEAKAQLRARRVLLNKLFPTVELNKNSVGQINREFNLSGKGNSVRRMLAGSDSDCRQLARDTRALPRSVRRISGQPK